ncbi:MAG: 4-hydroxythreonine-4-phosphate dehydrogenase PdxA [Deferrisomatales bacterium]|nr:4-hydroxythreonine-4-phosphate dehydrogenase PdxA [Deferrisomatales bacterium]
MTLTLALTCGEPAGVGAEVALKALRGGLPAGVEPVLVGPRGVWETAAGLLEPGVDLSPWRIREPGPPDLCTDPDWGWGRPTARSGRLAAASVELAARMALAGEVDALVTAPLTKEGLQAAGRPFPGHTELLAGLCGPGHRPLMLLAGPRLRVFLVTTHLPLARVPGQVTREVVVATLEAAHRGLEGDLGVPRPRLAVCGLNPHGGEGGLLGGEERDVIAPAVAEARGRGIRAEGPFPADSLFHRAAEGAFDGVVAMYHDQGLVALKLLHFWDAVNVTLGLPLVRTSPDHGTAFDLAGRGAARPDSFREAVRWAADIARRRRVAP